MRTVNTRLVLFFLLFITASACKHNKRNKTPDDPGAIANNKGIQKDTLLLTESLNKEDSSSNEYLAEKLQPIRDNFKRINSIARWTRVDEQDIDNAGEGGYVKYFYRKGKLEKLVARYFGETYQQLVEYYLLNGELSFVFDKTCRYNRPFNYDSTAMKENSDTEAFDINKSELIENRSYFKHGKLIHQLNNQDCGTPFTEEYLLGEQQNIQRAFAGLVGLNNKNN